MQVTDAQYIDEHQTGIRAIIDEEPMSVPVDEGNRHYRAIQRAVDAGTLTIHPHEPPPPPPWPERIATRRYEHEVAGTTFTHSDGNTYGIATDRQSQALTTGAAVQARRAQEAGHADWSKQWKTAQGFVAMSADDILAMGDAVDTHVQACFDREAQLVEKVADGTITESDLDGGWPSVS